MKTTIHANISDHLWQLAQHFVDQGWASNLESLIEESLRRYLDSHQESITEQFIRDDVEWGLRGQD
ncbi:MAG: hypothetical protein H7833_13035 [Magnetococcus sp. DMHC-1]